MNFLQLAQRLRREMNDSGEGPSSVDNQSGRNLEYVDAIRESWLEIQLLRPWVNSFWRDDFSPSNLQTLNRSTDTPFIPSHYHLAIVFYAMQHKALSQSAQELVLLGSQQWDSQLHLLCRDFLNAPTF